MSERASQSLYFIVTALIWSVVGVLAGFTLAFVMGMSVRQGTFFTALGLGIAWFGFSGFYGRKNGSIKDNSNKQRPTPPSDTDASRAWVDDFLVRQQKK